MRIRIACLLLLSCLFSSAQPGYRTLRRVHVERNQQLDPLFKGFSSSVLPVCLLTPATLLAVGYARQNPELIEDGWTSVGALAVSGGISLALKLSIRRDRPYVVHADVHPQVHTGPYSFPSAHSSNAFVTATSLSLAIPRWYVAVPAFAWAGAAAYSRLHLGVHHPGDVLAGSAIGAGSAILCHYLNRWYRTKYLSRK